MATGVGPEWLEFDALDDLPTFPLTTTGWKVLDYLPVRRLAPKVGENRAIDGVPGRSYKPRQFDELTVAFTVLINGQFDGDGVPYGDPITGAAANLAEFQTVVVAPLTARAVTYRRYEGDVYVGTVVVEDFDPATVPNSARDNIAGTLTLKVMSGALSAP